MVLAKGCAQSQVLGMKFNFYKTSVRLLHNERLHTYPTRRSFAAMLHPAGHAAGPLFTPLQRRTAPRAQYCAPKSAGAEYSMGAAAGTVAGGAAAASNPPAASKPVANPAGSPEGL